MDSIRASAIWSETRNTCGYIGVFRYQYAEIGRIPVDSTASRAHKAHRVQYSSFRNDRITVAIFLELPNFDRASLELPNSTGAFELLVLLESPGVLRA